MEEFAAAVEQLRRCCCSGFAGVLLRRLCGMVYPRDGVWKIMRAAGGVRVVVRLRAAMLLRLRRCVAEAFVGMV